MIRTPLLAPLSTQPTSHENYVCTLNWLKSQSRCAIIHTKMVRCAAPRPRAHSAAHALKITSLTANIRQRCIGTVAAHIYAHHFSFTFQFVFESCIVWSRLARLCVDAGCPRMARERLNISMYAGWCVSLQRTFVKDTNSLEFQ